MGVAYGEGKRNSVFSTFLLGAYQDKSLVPITRIGNGFSDEELGEYTKMFKDVVVNGMPDEYVMPARLSVSHFVKPNYVFQVSCQ
jgi:ATP-dependent DNA ligase